MNRLVRHAIAAMLLLNVADAAESLDEQVADLSDNSWIVIEPLPSKRLVLQERHENSPVVEITSREPAFREYTSPAFGDGKLFYFGGGHSGYFGNDVEIYDPTENTWRQCYAPKCPPKDDSTYFSGGSERSYVDPETGMKQPYVLHGYARTGYDPLLHRYVCTAMFPENTERDAATGKWKLVSQTFSYIGFDERTSQWELLRQVPDELKPGSTSLSFDPDLGGMVAFAERSAWLFHDGKWKQIAEPSVRLAASGGASAVYLSSRKSHLVAVLGHGGPTESGQLNLFVPAEKQGRSFSAPPDDLWKRIAPGTNGFNLVMSYDDASRTLVFMSVGDGNKPDVWTFDLAADRWQHLPPSASAPKLIGVFEPGRGRAPLWFDPARNVFLLAFRDGELLKLWGYRLRAAEVVKRGG